MKVQFNIGKSPLILAVVLICCFSCTDEKLVKSPVAGKSAQITFTIGMGDTLETRSLISETSDKIIGSFVLGSDSAVLSCEESMLGDTDGKLTRGTPVTTANLESVYGSFSVDALIFDENGEFEPLISIDDEGNEKIVYDSDEDGTPDDCAYFYDIPFVKDGSLWTIDTTDFPEYGYFNWPKKDYTARDDRSNFIPCSFFAYAPSFMIDPNEGQSWYGSYSYFGPDNEQYPNYYPDGKVEFYHLVDYWNEESFDEDTYQRNDSRVVLEDDAINEPDLLFASTGVVSVPPPGQPIELMFYHILSAVRFCVADDFPEGVELKYVMFDNIWWDGYCTFDPAASGTRSADKVSWEFPDGCARASFKQNFGAKVALSRDFNNDEIQGGDMLYGDDVAVAKTFWLIPQSFGATGNSPDAKIIVGMKINGEDKDWELSFPDGTEWKAGKLYTYKLHLKFNPNSDGVNITIDEDFPSIGGVVYSNPNVDQIYYKENVKLINTHTIKYYLRAAILAYELDNTNDDIIGNWWKDEEQWLMNNYHDEYDSFDNEGNPPSDLWGIWELNTDNDWKKFGDYYYYKYPVVGGASTGTLFDQLRVPCLHTERSEVDIIGQGIPWSENADHRENVATYWGSDIADWMSDDVKP